MKRGERNRKKLNLGQLRERKGKTERIGKGVRKEKEAVIALHLLKKRGAEVIKNKNYVGQK